MMSEQKTISITHEQAKFILAALASGISCAVILKFLARGAYQAKEFEESKDRLLKTVENVEYTTSVVRDFLTKKMKELSDGSPRD